MIVVLDPAVELLGAVDLLITAKTNLPIGPGRDYARALAAACAPWRTHPAVALNARLQRSDPGYFQRKDLLLLRSAPPELAFDEKMSACRGEAERSGEWEPWLAAMRDFARTADFPNLLTSASDRLTPDLERLSAYVEKTDYIGKIERYTGLTFQGRYRLILSALCEKGKSLNRVWTRDDGTHEIASIVRPQTSEPGDDLDAVVWHELGHGVMDMTVNLHDHEQKDAAFSLGPKLRNNCRNWLHGMREHLVRAVMLRLIALDKGEDAAKKQYDLEELSRRPHLAAFLSSLKEYEQSRDRYPTLADFYPRLREAFPRPAKPVKSRSPFEPGQDSWPDALRRLAGPFYTKGQRARAIEHLDALLSRAPSERLLLRRAILHCLSGREDLAAADAAAFLNQRPKDSAALLRWGSNILAKGRG